MSSPTADVSVRVAWAEDAAAVAALQLRAWPVMYDGLVPAESLPEVPAATTTPPEAAATSGLPPIAEGDPIARIEMPSIGVDKIVVAGVDKNDLKKGPGHYPETPMPGQLGNSAIAGHRTTFGQPFFDVDKLETGDEIVVTTLAGRYVYRVTGQQIVSPSDYQVISTTDPTRAPAALNASTTPVP